MFGSALLLIMIYVHLTICLDAKHCSSLTDVCYHAATASRIRCTAMGRPKQGKRVTDSVVVDEPSAKELAEDELVQEWAKWRIQHPPRAARTVVRIRDGRPARLGSQSSWTVYAGQTQTWFVVPFRRLEDENLAQPLAGAPDAANLEKHRRTSENTYYELHKYLPAAKSGRRPSDDLSC